MSENEMLKVLLNNYGEAILKEKGDHFKNLFYAIFPATNEAAFDDFKKDLNKVLEEEKKKLADNEKEEKLFMQGNSATYINPEIGKIFGKIFGKANDNDICFTKEVLDKAIENSAKHPKYTPEKDRAKEYHEAVKKAQESAKEYMAIKNKENPIVYIPISLEYSMSIMGEIDEDLVATTNILGVFTDPKKAEKLCETEINGTDDWTPCGPLLLNDASKLYKFYEGCYFFDPEEMVLTINHVVIFKTRANDMNASIRLSTDNIITQETYNKLLDVFNTFKEDYSKLLIETKNNVDKLLEMPRKLSSYEEGGEECQH